MENKERKMSLPDADSEMPVEPQGVIASGDEPEMGAAMDGDEPEVKVPAAGADAKAASSGTPRKNKMGMGTSIAMAVLAILALGGIAFGTFAMVTSGQEIAKKDDEISKLKVQVNGADGTKTELETETITITNPDGSTTEISNSGVVNNPVISAEAPVIYEMGFSSSNYLGAQGGLRQLEMSVKDGKINSCGIAEVIDAVGKRVLEECQIDGISGEIYKVVEIGRGQSNQDDVIGFIMTDGTVQYMPFYEAMESGDYKIKGSLNVDGFVRDTLTVNVRNMEGIGGYGATILVMGDSSFVQYSESMLE